MTQTPQKHGWQHPEPVALQVELQQLCLCVQQPLWEVLQLILIEPEDLQLRKFAKGIPRKSRDPISGQVQKC